MIAGFTEDSMRNINEARKLVKITHGSDHSILEKLTPSSLQNLIKDQISK